MPGHRPNGHGGKPPVLAALCAAAAAGSAAGLLIVPPQSGASVRPAALADTSVSWGRIQGAAEPRTRSFLDEVIEPLAGEDVLAPAARPLAVANLTGAAANASVNRTAWSFWPPAASTAAGAGGVLTAGAVGHPNHTQAEISRVTFNKAGDFAAILSALVFSIFTSLCLACAFTVLRRWNPAVYSRQIPVGTCASGDATPDVTERYYSAMSSEGWVQQVLATTPDEEVEAAGLDGWSLLEYYRLHSRIVMVIGPPILLVLCPAHYFAAEATDSSLDLLSRFDIGHLPDKSRLYWVHAAFVWFVVLAVSAITKRTHNEFLDRRFAWLKTIPSPQATTVMVENIPTEFRSDQALQDYFAGKEGLFLQGSHVVRSAYIVRKTPGLRARWEQLQETRKALALATHRLAGPDERLASQLREAVRLQHADVAAEQQRVERAVLDKDPRVCSSSGFVTFSSVLWQRLALKEHFRADITEFVVSMPPHPDDVVYDHLMTDVVGSRTWEFVGGLSLLLLFIFWSPVVVFISSWTTLSTIREYVPAVSNGLDQASAALPFLQPLLEGVLASAALKLFLAFLPSMLFGIITSFFHVKAGSFAQLRLGRWYFAFLVIFVLLVTTLGRSLVFTAVALAREPTRAVDLLAETLPRASHFYFSYMILGWVTLTWELIRISNLLRYWSLRVMYSSRPQDAKQFSEPEDTASFGLGTRFALASLMSAVTLVFCTCSPLVLALALVYFGLGRLTYGCLLVHMEAKKPDLGGLFWVEAVGRIFFTLFLYVLLMTGVLCAHSGTFWCGPAALSLSALLLLYAMWARIHAFEWETLPLEQLIRAWRAGDAVPRACEGVYRQPECPELAGLPPAH